MPNANDTQICQQVHIPIQNLKGANTNQGMSVMSKIY